jgi:hypothetical protein
MSQNDVQIEAASYTSTLHNTGYRTLHNTGYRTTLYSDFHVVDIMIKMQACLSLRVSDTIQ